MFGGGIDGSSSESYTPLQRFVRDTPMPHVHFTAHLQRHVAAPDVRVSGATVREALDAVFSTHRAVRGYILDEQGRLRRHVAVFVDGARLRDRDGLSDPVGPDGEIHVLQALSGG